MKFPNNPQEITVTPEDKLATTILKNNNLHPLCTRQTFDIAMEMHDIGLANLSIAANEKVIAIEAEDQALQASYKARAQLELESLKSKHRVSSPKKGKLQKLKTKLEADALQAINKKSIHDELATLEAKHKVSEAKEFKLKKVNTNIIRKLRTTKNAFFPDQESILDKQTINNAMNLTRKIKPQ